MTWPPISFGKGETMEALICSQCGAAINPKTMQCEYCGTHFKRSNDGTLWIETFKVIPKIYSAAVCVGKEYIEYTDHAHNYILETLANKMASAIAENMEYEMEEDPFDQTVLVRSRIRILPPAYRFS